MIPVAVRKAHHHWETHNFMIPVAVRKAHHHWGTHNFIILVAVRKAHHHWGGIQFHNSGGDALGGHTRSHPEHVAHTCVGLLRPKRPMVLCWRRHGRAGGCQIPKKIAAERRLLYRWFYQ